MPTLAELKKQQAMINHRLVMKERQANVLRRRIAQHKKVTAKMEATLKTLLGTAALSKLMPSRKGVKRPAKKKLQRKSVRRRAVRTTAKKTQAGKKKAPVRDVIIDMLSKANRPLSLDEILAGIRKSGVKMQSKAPRHSLDVRMYSDKMFRKVTPGHFTLRAK